MFWRVGKTAYRSRVRGAQLCTLLCVCGWLAGCLADTEAGEGRTRAGDAVRVLPPKPGQNDPTIISGGRSGAGAQPAAGGTGEGSGGGAGSGISTGGGGSAGSAPGTAGTMEATGDPVLPLDERTFDAGSDPARNMVQAGAVCQRLAQIQCAGEAFCCENPGRSVAQCETTMRDGCANEVFLDAVTANPITAFDAAKAAQAFDTIEMLASQCDTTIAEFGASATGLMSMLRGTLASGKSCSPKGFDKASAAASLAACTDSGTTACLPTSTLIWTCTARGAAGAQCFSDLNCQDGLHCPNPSLVAGEFGTAQCAPRKAEGAACMLPNECTSFACKDSKCAAPSAEAAYCLMN